MSLQALMRSLSTFVLSAFTLMAFSANWMHRLSDATFVASLSIPGAHDAATGEGFGSMSEFGAAYALTQELTIAEQWRVGVRAFDLRPAAYADHLHIHHGILATEARFDRVLTQLRDSLIANPSEFVIIHVRHEDEGDQADNFDAQMVALLESDALRPYLADFRKDLTVGDMRGKMLVLCRNKYASKPIGAFIDNWTSSAEWEKMTAPKLTAPVAANSCSLYVQDYYDTHNAGGMNTKLAAMKQLLNYSFSHRNLRKSAISAWCINFASGYSKVTSFFGSELATSDGNRDNAAQTHRFLLDFMAGRKTFGPTGIVMMDFVGVDRSGEYETLGLQTVGAIIENNFKYLQDITPVRSLSADTPAADPAYYTLSGQRIDRPRQGQVTLVRETDGTARKVKAE